MKAAIGALLLIAMTPAAFAGGPGHCYDPSTRAGYVCASDACVGNATVATKDGACTACGQKLAAVKGLTHVAVVLYDGVDLFDVAGPGEAFASAGGFYVYTVSAEGNAIQSGGLEVEPDFGIQNCPWPDVLVVGNPKIASEMMRDWIALVSKDADFVLKTGGVASGIDGALGIIAKTKGADSARRAARAMEYESWLAQAGGQK